MYCCRTCHALAFTLNTNEASAEKKPYASCKSLLNGLPPPHRCQGLCSTPLRWTGRMSRYDSEKGQTSLRCSSPEPGMRSSTWLSINATKLYSKQRNDSKLLQDI